MATPVIPYFYVHVHVNVCIKIWGHNVNIKTREPKNENFYRKITMFICNDYKLQIAGRPCTLCQYGKPTNMDHVNAHVTTNAQTIDLSAPAPENIQEV